MAIRIEQLEICPQCEGITFSRVRPVETEGASESPASRTIACLNRDDTVAASVIQVREAVTPVAARHSSHRPQHAAKGRRRNWRWIGWMQNWTAFGDEHVYNFHRWTKTLEISEYEGSAICFKVPNKTTAGALIDVLEGVI